MWDVLGKIGFAAMDLNSFRYQKAKTSSTINLNFI